MTSTRTSFPKSKLIFKDSESSTIHTVKKLNRKTNATFFVSKEKRFPLCVKSSTPRAKLRTLKEKKADSKGTYKANNDPENLQKTNLAKSTPEQKAK